MAGISKYDMPSGSPDGSGYMIAQRGTYALEKSGNFREGAESRLVSSLPGTSRPGGGLSQADPGGMFQSLLSDLKPAGLEQKFPRAGEIKRTLNNIFGVSSEDSIPATAGMTLTLSAREEIRRMKSSLSECSMKARIVWGLTQTKTPNLLPWLLSDGHWHNIRNFWRQGVVALMSLFSGTCSSLCLPATIVWTLLQLEKVRIVWFPLCIQKLLQVTMREDAWSHKVRKKELMLDVVGGSSMSSLRSPSGIGSSLLSGVKGKRSERERDGKGQNRDATSRNNTAKSAQPVLSNMKGERKNKTKPKQKTAQLSTSVNGLRSKATEASNTILPVTPKSHETVGSAKKEGLIPSQPGMQNTSNDLDLCDLQLPELDGDFSGHGQDISSWLNIDEDGMQDEDFLGLEIPMDDLSEVNMMI